MSTHCQHCAQDLDLVKDAPEPNFSEDYCSLGCYLLHSHPEKEGDKWDFFASMDENTGVYQEGFMLFETVNQQHIPAPSNAYKTPESVDQWVNS